jgi:hypothetical protein
MLRRRGAAVTRGYGLLNVAGAAVRVGLYSLPAPARFAGTFAYRRSAYRHWLALHAGNLFASAASLREHR